MNDGPYSQNVNDKFENYQEETCKNYYVYSMEKEQFTQERTDKKLKIWYNDRQGNRDYRDLEKVFCQLTDRSIKVFHKGNYYWDELPIHIVKVCKDTFGGGGKGLGCCSK